MKNKYLTNLDNLSLADCLFSILSRYAVILFINNEDFEQLVELDDFTTDYFFIINEAVPSGHPFYIVDEDLKKYIYVNIIKEKNDNVFRGRKTR